MASLSLSLNAWLLWQGARSPAAASNKAISSATSVSNAEQTTRHDFRSEPAVAEESVVFSTGAAPVSSSQVAAVAPSLPAAWTPVAPAPVAAAVPVPTEVQVGPGVLSTSNAANRPSKGENSPGVFRGAGAMVVLSAAASPVRQSAAPSANEDDGTIIAPAADSQIPMVFEPVSENLKTTKSQAAKIESLKQDFAKKSGGNNSSPAAREPWEGAVKDSDEQLRAWIGDDAFLAMEIAKMRGNK